MVVVVKMVVGGRMIEKIERHTDKQTDRQTDTTTDRQIDRQKGRNRLRRPALATGSRRNPILSFCSFYSSFKFILKLLTGHQD